MTERSKNGFYSDFDQNIHYVVPGEDDLLHVSIIPENDNLSISSLDDYEEAYDSVDGQLGIEYANFPQHYVS